MDIDSTLQLLLFAGAVILGSLVGMAILYLAFAWYIEPYLLAVSLSFGAA